MTTPTPFDLASAMHTTRTRSDAWNALMAKTICERLRSKRWSRREIREEAETLVDGWCADSFYGPFIALYRITDDQVRVAAMGRLLGSNTWAELVALADVLCGSTPS